MTKIFFYTVIFLISSSSVAFATTENPSSGNSSFDFFKILVSLLFVLLLIYLLFWILKKKNNFSGSRIYNHLGGLPLGQNKSVQVIEIGNKIYILGVGEDINLLEVLQNDEEKATIKDSTRNYNRLNTGLNNWLKTKLSQRLAERRPMQSGQFEQELAEKIAQMKDKRSQSVNSLLYDNERTKKSDQHEEF